MFAAYLSESNILYGKICLLAVTTTVIACDLWQLWQIHFFSHIWSKSYLKSKIFTDACLKHAIYIKRTHALYTIRGSNYCLDRPTFTCEFWNVNRLVFRHTNLFHWACIAEFQRFTTWSLQIFNRYFNFGISRPNIIIQIFEHFITHLYIAVSFFRSLLRTAYPI